MKELERLITEKDARIAELENFYVRVHKLEYVAGIVKPYEEKIAELEAENTRLFNLTGTYNTVLSNYSLKIKELEEQVEKLKEKPLEEEK